MNNPLNCEAVIVKPLGILGLSFQDEKSMSHGIQPFWQRANIGMFSISMSGFKDAPLPKTATRDNPEQPGGVFTLGDVEKSLFTGDINYIPLSSDINWQIPIDGLKLDGALVDNSKSDSVLIDSGTSLIGIPASLVRQIYQKIPGAVAGKGTYKGKQTDSHFMASARINWLTNFLTSEIIRILPLPLRQQSEIEHDFRWSGIRDLTR